MGRLVTSSTEARSEKRTVELCGQWHKGHPGREAVHKDQTVFTDRGGDEEGVASEHARHFGQGRSVGIDGTDAVGAVGHDH